MQLHALSDSTQYFAPRPRVASKPAAVHVRLPGAELDLVTDRGVFAYAQLDRGTDLLLHTAPPPPDDADALDLGAGYGAIAVVMALRSPAARMWAVDVNERALELCRANARAAGAGNVVVMTPDDVPAELRFSVVYSNPPVRVGKAGMHALLGTWLARLTPDGHAYLVVQRNLGSDSLARWLQEQGHEVERVRSRAGYRVLDVRPAPASLQ